VIPAAVADSWFFWLAIIDGLAGVYILPTVIGSVRQVEGLGLVICLNTIPVGWPAALILACMMPRREISRAPQRRGQAGSSGRGWGHAGEEAADGTAIAEDDHLGGYRMSVLIAAE